MQIILLRIGHLNILTKTHRVKNQTQPDWITSEILDTMKERDDHKRHGHIKEYKRLRYKISTLIKSA